MNKKHLGSTLHSFLEEEGLLDEVIHLARKKVIADLTAAAPVDGPRSDKFLTGDTGGTPIDGGEKGGGHGLFVVNWMRE
jgi:hypothetical protein